MRFIVIVLLVLLTVQVKISLDTNCGCEIFVEKDCQDAGCQWKDEKCQVKLQSSTQHDSSSFCSQFKESNCGKQTGCAFLVDRCVEFSSCTSYLQSTNSLCQGISSSCITDGTKCVEIGDCPTYKTSVSCVRDSQSNYCYWDGYACVVASTCAQLPNNLKTDADCRAIKSECTVSTSGGCQMSGLSCLDQVGELQCVWDRYMKIQCAWNGQVCLEKSCQSAPITIRSTQDCGSYMSGCVAQLGGGCVTLGQCSDIQIDDACIVDKLGNTCYWFDGKCSNRQCQNAPSLLGTFQECQNFLSTCVPNKKGGCKTYTNCTDLDDSFTCGSGLLQCVWNDEKNLCMAYSCGNASKKYNTYEKCIEFKSDCTVNQTKDGCSDRTCDNAPNFINTNYDCDQYKSGCITKSGGGCITNTDCNNIHYQDACLVDSQNRQCFWYNNQCSLKTCANAPTAYNTHEQCQLFSKLCTVKRTLNGCIDMTCEVVFQKNNCLADYLGQKCHWNGLCFDKTCENAPLTLIDDAQCRAYLSSCTVRDSGVGCKKRPYQCMEMVLPAQCVTNAYGVACAWQSGQCKVKDCWTADSSLTTYESCNAYFPGCTTTGNGCQPLQACNLYQNSASCRFDQAGNDCEYNNSLCDNKNCLTADNTHNSNTLCNTYLTGCIVAASGTGCMAKPATCGGMTTSLQCTSTSTNSSGGPCAWIGSCVDRTCSNAPSTTDYDTFSECNAFLNTCTVVATGTGGCMTMVSNCATYTSQRQCEQLLNGNKCSWYLTSCVNRQCIYSPDTASYDDKLECDAYDNRCAVVRRIGGTGCTLRKSTCNQLSEHQCVKDSSGTICTWNTSATPSYCLNRTCALTIGVSSFTPVNCEAWLSGCVVNNLASPTACMSRLSACSSYSYSGNCTYTSSNVQCYWNGSTCVTRTCSTTSGITDFDHSSCYSWMTSCTVNWPTSCAAKPTNCSDAINYDQCYKNSSNALCAWVGTACVDRTCTNHGYAVTIFTDANCSTWMPGCSGNPGATECEITRTCTNHGASVTTFTHDNCTGWSPLCTVSSDSTSCIDRTCTNYDVNVTDFSSTNCSDWLSKCTSNDDHTACISARTCTNHGSAVTVFNNDTCGAWWEECIVSGSACTQKTCYNHSLTIINHTNCNNWYYKCTASRDLLTCQPKTCANAILASYTAENCLDWLYTCTVNSQANGCVSKRTCAVTDLSAFNYANCIFWSNECTYTTSGQCNDKTCANSSGYVSPVSHINCESWLPKCTYNASVCTDKTCYNYSDYVLKYDDSNCSNWLSMCTVNSGASGCEPKTCSNHSLSTFTTATCQGWLRYCQANASGTACENTRACSPSLTTYSHVNCENYNYQCTYNNGSSCRYKACTDTNLITYNHQFCNSYLSDCTVNSALSACEQKTCYNHGAQVSTLNHANCQSWLSNCTAGNVYSSCIPKTCSNTNVTTFSNANCMAWWSGCVANSSGTACQLIRTCTNHNFTSTTHATCENWLSTCTNNGSTTCQNKTCALAAGNLKVYDPISCEMWMSTCTSNYDQLSCISRTCYNHGDQVTLFNNANCSGWLSYCVANSSASGCVANMTCSNAVVTSYTHTDCNTWLSSCTVNSTFDGCVTKTCDNYGTNVTSFTHTNCSNWLSTCTNLSSTACQDKNCSNINTGSYTSVTCNSWSPYCIANDANTACVSTRTCSNAVVTSYTHSNCYSWLNTCTVNGTNDGCTSITCANATPITLSGPYNDASCNAWKSTCTINSTLDGCVDRTCSNINITPNTSNCQSWGSCQFDGVSACVARTCTNHDSMTLNVSNCSSWLSTCSYYGGGDCEVIRTCANYSGSYTHSNCENWLSTCTRKSDSSGCTTKTCAAYTTVIGIPTQLSHCENYLNSCAYDTNTCVEKTCNNFSGSISQANCEAWSSRCTINIWYNGCTYKNSSTAITLTYTESICKSWSEAWSLNSSLNGCVTNCQDNGFHFSSYTHTNCQNWDIGCTVNSTGTGCAVKTCSNYTGAVSYANCTNWLSTCTNSNGNASCIDRTCYNQLQNLSLWFNASQCSTYRSDCTVATNYSCKINVCSDYSASSGACAGYQSYCLQGQLQCITHRTCSNYGSNVVVFNHYNCEKWLSTCTVNSAGTGCEVKTCLNASISTQLLNGYNVPTGMDQYQCVAWSRLCINNGSTACKLRQCSDTTSGCETYLAGCRTVSNFSYCDKKTCLGSSSVGAVSTCVTWMSYCTSSQSKRACITQRTCSNTNISVFNQYNCEQWNALCTVNGTNDGCMYKTCFNHGMTTTTNALCGQWLYTCKANAALNGCEIRTCTNYGTAFTNSFSAYCPYWMSGQCTYHSVNNACIPNRTCAQAYHGYNSKYDKYFCQDWLSTCTPNAGQTACIDKTCTNHGSEVTTFNHLNCYNWYDICTNDGSTACKDKTCYNHGANVSTVNAANCGLWLPICTFQTGESTCNYKSCTNYSSITLNAGGCEYWNSSCTYTTNAYDCEYKTCSNYSSTISESGCRGWLPYCTPDQAGNRCVSTRTCTNYGSQLTVFTQLTCANWMPTCTVNTTNDGCMDRSCDNYGTNLASFTLKTCSGWLSYCTNYSTTKCEIKHCTNYPSGMTITNANCSKWYSNCIMTPTSSNCQFKTCSNHSISTFNHANCSAWLSYCTVNSGGTACVATRTCATAPLTLFTHGNCQNWLSTCTVNSGGTACEPRTCTNHGSFVTTFTHNKCQDWDFSCTKNSGSTACEPKTCTNTSGVTFTHANCQTWLSTCTVNSGSTACINKTCANTTGVSPWTHSNCEVWLSSCQLNKPTSCTSLQSNCANAGVSYNQCVVDSGSYNCSWYNGQCLRRTCSNYTGTTFTHSDCETWLSTCTVQAGASPTKCVNKPTNCTDALVELDQCVTNISLVNCVWLSGSCQDRTCANYTGATFTHTDCQTWLSTCTVDSLGTHAGCVIKPQQCSQIITSDQCVVDYNNNVCFWTGTACKTRTCEDGAQTTSYDTDSECLSFLAACTVARVGECTTKFTNCSDYVQESHCYKNSAQGVCFWNTDTLKCADIKCSNAPLSYTTHTQCNTFLATCTALSGGGCMTLNGCLNYSSEVSCVISNAGDTCAWSGGKCYVKSCYTAAYDSTHDTHTECQSYLPNCTVIATGTGGCVPLTDCTAYTTERQCVINNLMLLCGWNGTKCDIKSCYTAPQSYNQHVECQSYLNECTTVAIGNGCQMKNTQCNQYQSEKQCVITINAQSCYWNPNSNACEIRTCQNAPDTALTATLCESHYQFCYTDYIYCRLQLCTDLYYTTDQECKLYNCATNGVNCIERKSCSEVQVQQACTTDNNNADCEWLQNRCVKKSCTTSPIYNTTEQECQAYYPLGNCTTKIGGGCKQKGECKDATVLSACTTSIDNEQCVWENNSCRSQTCDDLKGTSEEICALSGCIFNGLKCTSPQPCSGFAIESICIKGIDGPCKWISGSCIVFTGCSSYAGKTDQECKVLSTNCTSNGTNCIGLDLCANYVAEQACITGLDGDCIWWSNLAVCKRFLSCYDLPYLTHQSCYAASNKCTTDTVNGCIPLLLCSQYRYQDQCKISASGLEFDSNNYITATGYCKWDAQTCRAQACEDLSGETHEACQSQLNGCTTDSTQCITISSCEEYDQQACLHAQSLNGRCTYSEKCQTQQCSDIKYGFTHETCQGEQSNCISDGDQCISIDVCSNYAVKYSCNYGGLDGDCVWQGSSCSKITQCSDADNDKEACLKFEDKCRWNSDPVTGTSCSTLICTDLTIDTCHNILTFDGTYATLCGVENSICTEIAPTNLIQDNCYSKTYNSYYWNPQTSVCTQCNTTNTNNSNNTTNATNTTNSNSGATRFIGKEQEDERELWSKHYSGNGQAYYYNVKTGQSQWEKPECLQDEESEVEQEWQQYLTEDGKPYWYNRVTNESKWNNPQEDEVSSGDEEDIIPPNPIEQYTQLLRDNKITSNVRWDFVVKQLQVDPRWKCIASISQKKKIYNQYLQEMVKQEKEENKTKLSMAKEDFMRMLEDHKILTSDIKLWKVQSYLVTDPRWKAISDEKERENLFQDYLDKLYRQEQEAMKENRKTTTEDFRKRLQRYIEVGVLSHSSTWDDCLKLFSQDRLLQIMLPIDALGVFEEVINPLYEQWRQSIISKYRQNRINFRELLQEHLSEGLLTHKTKWGQFVQTIQQDDRFICMLGQPGSQPHELFQDFISHLKQNHQVYKSELKMHLQQKGVKVLINVPFEEVDGIFVDNQIWAKMPVHEKKYYYRYFQENIKQSSNIQSKRFKKLCKRYNKLLKSFTDYKPYDEMLPQINQKITENPKLAGLVEEQKKALYEQFVSNLGNFQTIEQPPKQQPVIITQQPPPQMQEEPPAVVQVQQVSEKDNSERKKKKKKEKKEKKEKKQKEEGSIKPDIAQIEPEKTKIVKQEPEPEDGEIPNLDFIEQEKSKSKGKKHHRSHHKSKKHHKQ